MGRVSDIRIAWLLPVAWFYWQPALSQFARLFPDTTVFTGLFPGFARGLEATLNVRVVGKFKVVEFVREETGYGSNFTYLSPGIIVHLLRLRPQVIFSSSFGIWTILALALKPLFGWRVIIAYEGSSPGVDYRNSALRLFVRRVMIWLSDACITNSQAGRAYLIEVLGAKPNRVFVQPYEIPDEKTLPVSSASAELDLLALKHPVFLYVGHVIPRKGLQLLLESCAILKTRNYDSYTLLIVGDGLQRGELEEFSEAQQLGSQVRWAGRVNYDQIGNYFRSADVFVFPTLEDTWGVVTLEAMLFGKGILCSQGAGTAELVADGENGYVFDPHQATQLANLMQKFLDDPELSVKMGEKSRQIMTQYTPEAAATCLSQVTELVMKQ